MSIYWHYKAFDCNLQRLAVQSWLNSSRLCHQNAWALFVLASRLLIPLLKVDIRENHKVLYQGRFLMEVIRRFFLGLFSGWSSFNLIQNEKSFRNCLIYLNRYKHICNFTQKIRNDSLEADMIEMLWFVLWKKQPVFNLRNILFSTGETSYLNLRNILFSTGETYYFQLEKHPIFNLANILFSTWETSYFQLEKHPIFNWRNINFQLEKHPIFNWRNILFSTSNFQLEKHPIFFVFVA